MEKQFDPYVELGVDRAATSATIKNAHRRRAKKTHPDHGGSPEAFVKTQRAVAILLDPLRRSKFDRDGTTDDDKPIDTMRSEALAQIHRFIQDAVRSYLTTGDAKLDPRRRKLLQELCAQTREEISTLDATKMGGTRVIALLEDMATRFTVEGQDNPISRMIGDEIRAAHAQQASISDRMEMLHMVIKICGSYKYRMDAMRDEALLEVPAGWQTGVGQWRR